MCSLALLVQVTWMGRESGPFEHDTNRFTIASSAASMFSMRRYGRVCESRFPLTKQSGHLSVIASTKK